MITPDNLRPFLDFPLEETNFTQFGERYKGKVRDVYKNPATKKSILIATDRQSAFDISWCNIPLKGQVLNQLSAWWFSQIEDIMPTQVISLPDANVMIVKELRMLKVEIVIRSYLTGSSSTAIWTNYKEGVRTYCGHNLPDGMVKNQKLPEILITPTTKGEEDLLIDREQVVSMGLATQEQWEEIEEKAMAIFKRGQEIAASRGLILVDTKYEIGLDENGVLTIGDEVHTPDSSRYWVADTYQERFETGEEPQSLDKEFFRLWLREQGFEYGDKSTWPEITDDVRVMLASKYIDLFERMTGQTFTLPENPNALERIEKALEKYKI